MTDKTDLKVEIRKNAIFIAIAAFIFVLDQATKTFAKNTLAVYGPKNIVNGFLSLTYSQNTGAAFGILRDQTWIFVWLSIIVIGFIMYFYPEILANNYYLVGISLILGGVAGNLVDRVFRGFVIDFIDIGFWPIFNVADTALTIGVLVVAIFFLQKNKEYDKKD